MKIRLCALVLALLLLAMILLITKWFRKRLQKLSLVELVDSLLCKQQVMGI